MAGELNLKVDQATYEQTIEKLEGYVNQLKNKLNGFFPEQGNRPRLCRRARGGGRRRCGGFVL